MLFELFITVHLQIQLLSKDIFSYCNSEFENNPKSTESIVMGYDSRVKRSMQKIVQT